MSCGLGLWRLQTEGPWVAHKDALVGCPPAISLPLREKELAMSLLVPTQLALPCSSHGHGLSLGAPALHSPACLPSVLHLFQLSPSSPAIILMSTRLCDWATHCPCLCHYLSPLLACLSGWDPLALTEMGKSFPHCSQWSLTWCFSPQGVLLMGYCCATYSKAGAR